jgi:recombination protein RecT
VTNKSKAVATKAPADPVRTSLAALSPELQAALPAHVTVEKFTRVAMTSIQNNPQLREAEPRSLYGAIVKLAQDGLMPDGREAALVIFNKKSGQGWVKNVQPMPMIAGLLKMMRQSGEVAWVDAQVVHEKDGFQYRPGLDETPIFEPNWFGDRGAVIGVYAVAKLKSGETVPPEIMSMKDIEKIRKASRSPERGPWADWFEEMALKSVLRRLLKRLPTSTDKVMGIIDSDTEMAARPFQAVTQIEHDDIQTVEPEPVSRLAMLENDEPEPEPEPKPARKPRGTGEPLAAEDVIQTGKAMIDACTSRKSLKAEQKKIEAMIKTADLSEHEDNNVREVLEKAFTDMDTALANA